MLWLLLEAILEVAKEILNVGCITGDCINGLCDEVSGSWYIKFDTFTHAKECGLLVTRVISRMTLQQILARSAGEDLVINDRNVIDFEDDGNKVIDVRASGQCYKGDLLVGANGIWSKVRRKLFGPKEAMYSGYTCQVAINNVQQDSIPDLIAFGGLQGGKMEMQKHVYVSTEILSDTVQDTRKIAFLKQENAHSHRETRKKGLVLYSCLVENEKETPRWKPIFIPSTVGSDSSQNKLWKVSFLYDSV